MKLSSAQLSRVSAACFWMPARDTLPGLLWLPWAMGLAVVCPWRIGKSIRYLCSMQGLMGSMSSLNSSCLYGWYGWAARLQVGQCHWCASQRKGSWALSRAMKDLHKPAAGRVLHLLTSRHWGAGLSISIAESRADSITSSTSIHAHMMYFIFFHIFLLLYLPFQ